VSPIEVVSYCRVSTVRQGADGLGIDAQQAKVREMAAARGAVVVSEFLEVESGRKSDRPQLAAALAAARKRGAVLVVAKLDRLSRDAELILRLSREAESNGMAGIWFADLPDIDSGTAAGRMVLSVMASVAEFESRRIGERTREALAAAKARGRKLGGLRASTRKRNDQARDAAAAASEKLRRTLEALQRDGASYRAMARALADIGHTGRTGEALSPSQISRHLQRLGLLATA
jgi:DNA invertase Pin-like site-specific DNA recombinase